MTKSDIQCPICNGIGLLEILNRYDEYTDSYIPYKFLVMCEECCALTRSCDTSNEAYDEWNKGNIIPGMRIK